MRKEQHIYHIITTIPFHMRRYDWSGSLTDIQDLYMRSIKVVNAALFLFPVVHISVRDVYSFVRPPTSPLHLLIIILMLPGNIRLSSP